MMLEMEDLMELHIFAKTVRYNEKQFYEKL
jgi:hypothetical protein